MEQKEVNQREKKRDLSLRSYFMLTVFAVFCVVVFLSGLTVAGCMAFRHYLLPDADAAYLTVEQVMEDGTAASVTILLDFGELAELPKLAAEQEETREGSPGHTGGTFFREAGLPVESTYSIQKLERGIDTLTPKRKLAYRLCGAAMVVIPAMLSIGGILFCGFYFYRKRLSVPLRLLSDACGEVAAQNLDFTLEYGCGDEMGQLCRSFETMRRELVENNRAMWKLLEQRRMLQASIAHDLRNPISIIRGYTEYLQIHLPEGNLSREKTGRIVGNLNMAAKRLEQYTESVRTLNQLEDMEICRKEIPLEELVKDIRDDLEMIADAAGITLRVTGSARSRCAENHGISDNILSNQAIQGASDSILSNQAIQGALNSILSNQAIQGTSNRILSNQAIQGASNNISSNQVPENKIQVDIVILHRILENIFENAVRYAKENVSVDFLLRENILHITVTDDGKGFPDEILCRKKKTFLPTQEEGHLGMGLAISRLLCEKHGGSLEFGNAVPQGGIVILELSVG